MTTPSYLVTYLDLRMHVLAPEGLRIQRGPDRNAPKICFQNHAVQANFGLRGSLGSKLCWASLTRILDPSLTAIAFSVFLVSKLSHLKHLILRGM